MYINSVKALVKASNPDGIKDFGFSYTFSNGLNILTGDNSSGKSTVLSCINYCLGLEQLIGSKGIKALSPALHQALSTENGSSFTVQESECFLEFTGIDNKKYLLRREIKSENNNHLNEIIIKHNSQTFSKFVHSPRDHSDNGFFKWLAEVSGLDFFEVEGDGLNSIKPLYMQNIFTLSFIEQTKGWSDLFSMMPPFGIKEPKQKIVEYCLGLSSLSTSMELDSIKIGKEKFVEKWKNSLEDLEYRAQSAGLYLSNIEKNKPTLKNNIQSFYFAKTTSDLNELKYKDILLGLDSDISLLESRISELDSSELKTASLLKDSNEIKKSLARYTLERKEIVDLHLDEKYKLSTYSEALSNIDRDLQDFQDIQKVSLNQVWGKITNTHCPVCDSNIEYKKDVSLSSTSIDKSLSFLKSQKLTYKKYTSASYKVIQRYVSALEYYNKTISFKRGLLDSLYEDLKSPRFNSSRKNFEDLADAKYRRRELLAFNNFFEKTKLH